MRARRPAGAAGVDPQDLVEPGADPHWCGSSDVKGSWKTIWMTRARSRRARALGRSSTTSPASRIVPALGGSSPTSIRATVVLPDPDSPTMPSEPPRGNLEARSRQP